MTAITEVTPDKNQPELVPTLPRSVYEYRYEGIADLSIEVVTGDDPRVTEAIEMEIAAMSALGDPPEEVRAEFEDYNDKSYFFLAFDKEDTGEHKLLGMGRVIPFDADTINKSLNDLATIPGWQADGVPTTVQDGHERHSLHDVVSAFQAESGCTDMRKVWDIATLAPALDIIGTKKGAVVADAIIASFTQEVLREANLGNVTHVTSFNQSPTTEARQAAEAAGQVPFDAHGHFVKLGYPYHRLFDLEPMLYDSFDSGEGMTAQIAWLSAEDLRQAVTDPQTRHMSGLAAHPSMQHVLASVEQTTVDTPDEQGFFSRMRTLLSAGHEDFKHAGLGQKVGLIATAACLAYEWGPGNETMTPVIGSMAIDHTSGLSGILATSAIAGGFTALQQTGTGVITSATVSTFPNLVETAYHLYGSDEDAPTRQSWEDTSKAKQFGDAIALGASYVAVREAFVTGDTSVRPLNKQVLRSAAISGGSVAVLAGGIDGAKLATDNSFIAEGFQATVDYLENPVKVFGTYMGILAVSKLGKRVFKGRAASN